MDTERLKGGYSLIMKKLYDLAVRSGSYTGKDGSDKSTWLNVGSVWEGNDDRQFMFLRAAFNPAAIERKNGSDCISVSMFPPKSNSDNRSDNFDSDVQDYDDSNPAKIPF